jgi:hypothetical protein
MSCLMPERAGSLVNSWCVSVRRAGLCKMAVLAVDLVFHSFTVAGDLQASVVRISPVKRDLRDCSG